MTRPLVIWTLLIVGGVVLLLGAGLIAWITAQDAQQAREDARDEHAAVESALRALSDELIDSGEDIAQGLSQSARERLRDWLEQEPLSLYRDPTDPTRIDMEALMQDLVAQVRALTRAESERIGILTERLELQSEGRIEAAMDALRTAYLARSERALGSRSRALLLNLGLLLVGLAGLLVLVLVALAVVPLRKTQAAVRRIASGQLDEPVAPIRAGAAELVTLAADVERMRQQMRDLTSGLEAEVARKTADLERTLAERTQTLEELRATQDRLVQAAKMAGLGTLAGGVAHEFNNLLGGILGCVESARRDVTDPSAREDLDVAARTAQRAATLIRALLDVARPGQRAFSSVDLDGVVEDVLRAAAPTATRHGVRIEREGGGAPPVSGDEGQLHQVVLNLVTNALQAVDEGGRIVVSTREEAGKAVVEVRDDGAGVAPEDRDRLFEPFFTTREDGTGLGLFVSYGIVERHGGALAVGEAPEGGAAFALRLPAAS